MLIETLACVSALLLGFIAAGWLDGIVALQMVTALICIVLIFDDEQENKK